MFYAAGLTWQEGCSIRLMSATRSGRLAEQACFRIEIQSPAADHLRAFFRPLGLNEIGLCEQCAEAASFLETRARENDRA